MERLYVTISSGIIVVAVIATIFGQHNLALGADSVALLVLFVSYARLRTKVSKDEVIPVVQLVNPDQLTEVHPSIEHDPRSVCVDPLHAQALIDAEQSASVCEQAQLVLHQLDAVRNKVSTAADTMETLAHELSFYHTFSDITRSQLSSVNDEAGQWTLSAMDHLQQIGVRLQDIFASMDDFDQITANAFGRVSDECDLLSDDQKLAQSQLLTTCTEAERLLPYVQEVKEVAQKIRILALNAAIEAARAGNDGRAFAVIGREVSDLSNKSTDLAVRIQHDIHSTLQDLRNNVLSINERSRNRIESIRAALTDTSTANAHMAANQRERVGSVKGVLSSSIDFLLGGAQQQDVSRQQIETVDKAIGALDEHSQVLVSVLSGEQSVEHVPKFQDILDGLYARYVMQSQRRAHGSEAEAQNLENEVAIELF